MDYVHLIHPTIPGQEALATGAKPVRACNPDEPHTGMPEPSPDNKMCQTCQDVIAWSHA